MECFAYIGIGIDNRESAIKWYR